MSSAFKNRDHSLFRRAPSVGAKVLFLVVLSVAIMALDHHYHKMEWVRTGLSAAVYPLRLAAAVPADATHAIMRDIAQQSTLIKRNKILRQHILKLNARLQKLHSLQQENTQLRALMNASAKTQGELRIAEIMSVALDPFRQTVVLNQGKTSGVYVGQPILSAKGIMGQVTHVSPLTSVGILITDPNAAVPVEILRNGLRTIALGTGKSNTLDLPYLPNNAAIKAGDILITSGLSGRYPRGYPVGTVTVVKQEPGQPFADIKATPTAALNRRHEVLLLWPSNKSSQPQSKPNPKATQTSEARHD